MIPMYRLLFANQHPRNPHHLYHRPKNAKAELQPLACCSSAKMFPSLPPLLRAAYGIMTTFMLHGAKVRLSGRVGELMVLVVGGAQVLVPAGSGNVPVGEPDKS